MSYRQLARMAPATRSVHRVLAIKSKTHFAKNVFDRYGLARLTWEGRANNPLMPDGKSRFQICPVFPAGSAKFPLAVRHLPLPIYSANPTDTERCLSYHCNRIELKINRFEGLVLLRKQQFVGQKAGTAVQRALGCDPCQFGKIIAFREMRQNHVGSLAVIPILERPPLRVVRQVTNARKYPVFH